MKNQYLALFERQQEEFNTFPMFFAFSDKQFEEGMARLGLKAADTDQIYSMGQGGYYRRSNAEAFKEMGIRHEQELQAAIKADPTGEGFIKDMFYYELSNHEYSYTHDIQDTLEALDYTVDEVRNDEALFNGLQLALKEINQED